MERGRMQRERGNQRDLVGVDLVGNWERGCD